MHCKVGTFQKIVGTGSQTITHNLNQTPKLLIIWSVGGLSTDGSFSGSVFFGLGVGDGIINKSISFFSQDAVGISNTSKRHSDNLVSMINASQTNLVTGDFTSMTSTQFTINWVDGSSQWYFNYMILGGLISAKLVEWTMNTSTGNQSISGVGFKPTVCIHFGTFDSAVTPSSIAGCMFGFGAMDGAGNQWALALSNDDNVSLSNTARAQDDASCIYSIDGSGTQLSKASFVSMNSSGFTINVIDAPATGDRFFTICLGEIGGLVGKFSKSTGAQPASQIVSGLGFLVPEALLISSCQAITLGGNASARYGLGGSDGTNECAIAIQDTDNLGTTSCDKALTNTKAFMKVDNNTPAVDAEADMTGFSREQFSLNWTTNDAVNTSLFYIALGSLVFPKTRIYKKRKQLPRKYLRR